MNVRGFYDTLAPWYHLIYTDWDRSVHRQSNILSALIESHWGPGPQRVWDAAAGIGTQAIGLARAGHHVVASDLSAASVHRARHEARVRGIKLAFAVSDMGRPPFHHSAVDLVVACDNSVPHLLSAAAIRNALVAWRECTAAGGGFLLSMRDYGSAETPGTEQVHDYGTRVHDGRAYAVRQVWTWEPARRYVLRLEIRDETTGTVLAAPATRYFAISPPEVADLATAAGFTDVAVVESDYYQPVLIGHARNRS